MIIYSVPKPMVEPWKTLQEKSIKSWGPHKVLLFGNEPWADLSVEVNSEGTPLLSSILESISKTSPSRLVMLINTDIILTDSFHKTVNLLVSDQGHRDLFLIGRRTDLPDMKLHSSSGIDYFIFNTGFLHFNGIPLFTYGRTAWDNWLVWYAKSQGCFLVDITREATVYHQAHDYSHSKGDAWTGLEAIENQLLAGKHLLTIDDTDYILKGEWLIPNLNKYFRRLKSVSKKLIS